MALLALYELDRGALKAFTSELEAVLLADDGPRLAALLELGGDLFETIAQRRNLIELFVLPEDAPQRAPVWASLRRVSRKRSMTKVFTSTHATLEGRLRAYDVLRDDKEISRSVDRLLNPKRLPWYLRRAGATCGWLSGDERARLVQSMTRLRAALTPELVEALDGLVEIDGDVVAHDAM